MPDTYEVRNQDMDMYIFQGEDWEFKVTILDNDIPRDFTGYTGKMQIREAPGSPVLLELATSGSGITLNSIGEINLEIDNTDTTAFEVSKALYDLKVKETSSGSITPIVAGNVLIRRQITEMS